MENMSNVTLFSSLNSVTMPWLTRNESTTSWEPSGLSEGAHSGKLPTRIFELVLILSLMVIQCGLMHPKFEGSSSARLTRLSLGPLIIGWWACYPFRLPVVPLEERNILPGFIAAMMIFKAVEWTFDAGPYRLRSLTKSADGRPVWQKEATSDKLAPEKDTPSGLGDFVLWIFLQFGAQRGFRWSWGPAAKGNESSFLRAFLEVVRLHLVLLPCLGFVLYSQDFTTYSFDSRKALISLGVPSFPGLGLLACGLHSMCAMFVISTSIEMMSSVPALLSYPLYPLLKRTRLPPNLVELVNPVNFPPQFGPMFELSSLAHFWGKTWHQKFRRPFLFCGGKPAMSLARALGGSTNVQKVCGVMGVFALSGLFHEYPMYAFQREPHPYPRELFKTLPASFLFFFVQSFGLILEPFIIPHIPKRLGGAKLWTCAFLFLTAPLFTRDICRPPGMFGQYRHPQQWTWLDLVIPAPLAARILSNK
ncbi:hypothetical protein PtA15_9A311 [Puccinia triticina]|uniref:Wax synthase domain-containing protein n=1 Tax=Puccinia triticina TaxID=208348 RepID=A0ABY7CSF9_9BASI|nr:uncharacterized protein PtA15_9A311 [Puccinia triticina]WAQ88186.1 hypothetical protein PtA15_9A311 [Puccinia triticina]